MCKTNIISSFIRLLIRSVFILFASAAIISGILVYTKRFSGEHLSTWFFYTALLYMIIAVIPVYSVLTSSNAASLNYGEYRIKGKIDITSRIDDVIKHDDYRFSFMIFVSGLLMLALSAFAYTFI